MSDSRTHILQQVRVNRASAMDLPSLDQDWQTFDDPVEHFRALLSSLGAQSELLSNKQAADAWLSQEKEYANAQQCVSQVAGVGRSTLDPDQLTSPHELAEIDWAVLPGEFGVAENGAIWVTCHSTRHRAIYFLCEHLVLVLPLKHILHNMHQAYQRLGGLGTDGHTSYGTFVAGPSKTADIEQSLVIGAQGPRSLHVLLLEQGDD